MVNIRELVTSRVHAVYNEYPGDALWDLVKDFHARGVPADEAINQICSDRQYSNAIYDAIKKLEARSRSVSELEEASYKR